MHLFYNVNKYENSLIAELQRLFKLVNFQSDNYFEPFGYWPEYSVRF